MVISIRMAATATATLILGVHLAQAADLPVPEPVYIEQPVVDYQPAPYYARFDCAYAFMQEPDLRVGKPERHFIEKNGGRIEIDDGWSCDIGLGHQLTQELRYDVTLEYRGPFEFDAEADPAVAGSLSQRADIQSVVTMFNAYWDFANYGGFTPYIGAGIGVAYNMMGPSRVSESGFETDGADHTSFAWALMAGTAWDISQDWKLDVGYRYLNFGEARSSTQGSDGSIVPKVKAKDLEAHEIRVGFRYEFY